MPSPLDCMKVNIARWEGLWQAMPDDPGNWLDGRLIGTMRGVTPAVLMAHLAISAATITPAFMQRTVTLDLAAEIGLARYYEGWIDPIAWCAAADAVTDFGWGSGPGQAVKTTERDLLGLANADSRFDAVSVGAWAGAFERRGAARLVWDFHDVRQRFYDLICDRNPTLHQFRKGWDNRARWMTPGGEWWTHWLGESPERVIDKVQPMPADTTPRLLLTKGMRGADVLAVQRRLVQLSYPLPRSIMPSGDLDGVYGGETEDAVRRLQESRQLTVDGWVGPRTRVALGL